jgi:hypothetical protein
MADEPELSPAGDQSSSDEETVKGERDEDHIADLFEEEGQAAAIPLVSPGAGTIATRYRELLASADEERASEDGSTDALPRRAGSPIESLMSIPDDLPSTQVCHSHASSQTLLTIPECRVL